MICRWCDKEYEEPLVDGKVESCPHCEGVYPEGVSSHIYKDVYFRDEDKR